MSELIFQTAPSVTIATNTFVNVPNILRYEDTNLIEIIRDLKLGFTTQIPIYHSDGTYLAKVNGTRMFLTEAGKKTGLKIDKYSNVWTCKLDTKTLFEIHHQSGDAFKVLAELFTPDGYFVKCLDSPTPGLINVKGNELKVGGVIMSGNLISGCKTGIWIRKNGAVSIGVNQ
ncbi:MAG: hypothetical protein A2041_02235 [Bacteroidetes bacterium GWA2_31_9b]|nr:MAG: hypothetical protein A2041_02235 [Bacteroidetes bacterium GWA2_31_9b]